MEYRLMEERKKKGGGGGVQPWKRKKASSSKHPRGSMGKPVYSGGKTQWLNELILKPAFSKKHLIYLI